jgi:hypothetical protein
VWQLSTTNPVRVILSERQGEERQVTFELTHSQTADVPLGAVLCLDKESETKYRITSIAANPVVAGSSKPPIAPVTPLSSAAIQAKTLPRVVKTRLRPTEPQPEQQSKRLRRTGLQSTDDVWQFMVEACAMDEEEAAALRKNLEIQKIDGFVFDCMTTEDIKVAPSPVFPPSPSPRPPGASEDFSIRPPHQTRRRPPQPAQRPTKQGEARALP